MLIRPIICTPLQPEELTFGIIILQFGQRLRLPLFLGAVAHLFLMNI